MEYNVERALLSLFFMLFPFSIAAIFYFRKQLFIERIFLGAFFSYMFLSVIGFFLIFFGINYNQTLAYLLIALSYLISLAIAFKYRSNLKELINFEEEKNNIVYSLLLVAIIYIVFITRLTSLTPIYYELDPYFYLYVTYQLLTLGELPLDDKTAWYPILKVDHRTVPSLGFYQAVFYSLNENDVDIYKLSFYAAFYPVIASIFMAFFVYLSFKQHFHPLLAIAASFIFITTPGLAAKTQASLFEAQPNAFLFHIAGLTLLHLTLLDRKYLPLLFITFIGYMPAATTQAQVSFFYLLILTFFLFFEKDIKQFLPIYIFYGITNLIYRIFTQSTFPLISFSTFLYGVLPFFLAIFLLFKEKIMSIIKEKRTLPIFKVAVFSFAVIVIYSAFFLLHQLFIGIATFSIPLARTIAEQNPMGENIQPLLGVVGLEFKDHLSFLSIFSDAIEALFIVAYKIIEQFGYILIYIKKVPNLLFLFIAFLSFLFLRKMPINIFSMFNSYKNYLTIFFFKSYAIIF